MTTVFHNGWIFAPFQSSAHSNDHFVDCMAFTGERISHVGSLKEASIPSEATMVNLENRIVLPGFIDAHVHILQFGHSLRKLNLIECTSFEQIRAAILSYAKANPSMPRILCRGWIQSSTKGVALARIQDDLDPHLPGGKIHRDENGRASGLLDESALINLAWPYLESTYSTADKVSALNLAVSTYSAAGYTGIVDMAMDKATWDLLETSIFAMLIAIELRDKKLQDPTFCVVGIKLICDGVVDGCTAALYQPYTGKTHPEEPIWPADMLKEVVHRADTAGLQCAIHAIGDNAVNQAINVLSGVGTPGRRHKIEHLELPTSEDAKCLGELGITASVQPVHSDPALFKAWPGLIEHDRCQHQLRPIRPPTAVLGLFAGHHLACLDLYVLLHAHVLEVGGKTCSQALWHCLSLVSAVSYFLL
ncbi:amidohydrolase family-domain-containing protein [Aspergillus pseudoustus]|uniref:Amidohydrolase family-domain-containing protein n=1 Tax=Aspergillus pseudoustus TaxID=1810923 RepID=A0ABR4JXE5_9EURO